MQMEGHVVPERVSAESEVARAKVPERVPEKTGVAGAGMPGRVVAAVVRAGPALREQGM